MKNQPSMDQILKTTDIVLAAYLKIKEYKLHCITKSGNCGTFHFVDVPDFVVNDFALGNCKVEPTAFHQQIGMLTKAVREAV